MERLTWGRGQPEAGQNYRQGRRHLELPGERGSAEAIALGVIMEQLISRGHWRGTCLRHGKESAVLPGSWGGSEQGKNSGFGLAS